MDCYRSEWGWDLRDRDWFLRCGLHAVLHSTEAGFIRRLEDGEVDVSKNLLAMFMYATDGFSFSVAPVWGIRFLFQAGSSKFHIPTGHGFGW